MHSAAYRMAMDPPPIVNILPGAQQVFIKDSQFTDVNQFKYFSVEHFNDSYEQVTHIHPPSEADLPP